MSDSIVCSSCKRQKSELHAHPSRLMKGQTLIYCNECNENKFEPRWLIVLVGKQQGISEVKEYIEKHRYYGDPITAKELMPLRG